MMGVGPYLESSEFELSIPYRIHYQRTFQHFVNRIHRREFNGFGDIGRQSLGFFQVVDGRMTSLTNLLDLSDTYLISGYDNKFAIKRRPATIEDLQQRVGNVV
jgi:hypothetical protein